MPWVIPAILGIIVGVIGTLLWFKKKWSTQLHFESQKHQKAISQLEADYQQRLADTKRSLKQDYDNRIQEVTNELATTRKQEAEAKVKVLQTDYQARLVQVTEELKRSHEHNLATAVENLKQEHQARLQALQTNNALSSSPSIDQTLNLQEIAPEKFATNTESIGSPEVLYPLETVPESASLLEPEPVHPVLTEDFGVPESEISPSISVQSPQTNEALTAVVDEEPNLSEVTNLVEPTLQTYTGLDSVDGSSPFLEELLKDIASNHNTDRLDFNVSEERIEDLGLPEPITTVDRDSNSDPEDVMLPFSTSSNLSEEEMLDLTDLDALLDSEQVAELESLMAEGHPSSLTDATLDPSFDFSNQSFEPEISAIAPDKMRLDLDITIDQEVGENILEQAATLTVVSPDILSEGVFREIDVPSEMGVLSNSNYRVHEIKFFEKDGELYVALFDSPLLFYPEFWIKNMQAKELGIQQLPENMTLENKYPVESLGFEPFIVPKSQE